MKRFPYKFTTLVKWLFVLAFTLAIAVIAVNIVHFLKNADRDTYSYITLITTLLVAVIAIIFGISMLVSSYFQIDDNFLTLRWGIVKNQIKLSDINKLIKMEKSNKLLVYFTNESYMVVFINPEIFDDFSTFLLSKNKNIVIEYTEG